MILLAIVAIVVVSTGSSLSADGARDLEFNVVGDDEGYLGIEQQVVTHPDGRTSVTVSVTNQFPDTTRLDAVYVTVAGETQPLLSTDTLTTGETVVITFDDVTCGESVTVEAEGDRVSVQATRQVDCLSY
jgi:hypothetical protein